MSVQGGVRQGILCPAADLRQRFDLRFLVSALLIVSGVFPQRCALIVPSLARPLALQLGGETDLPVSDCAAPKPCLPAPVKAVPSAALSTAPIGAGTQKEMLARLYQIAQTATLSL
jgi:hypothetical protein